MNVLEAKKNNPRFINITDYGYDRGLIQAVIFYLTYLLIVAIATALIQGILNNLFGLNSLDASKIVKIFHVLFCLALALPIIWGKKIYNNILILLLPLMAGILATYMGALFGLLPIAYLTTYPSCKNEPDAQRNKELRWYHRSWLIIILIILFGLTSWYSALLLSNLEEQVYYRSPYQMMMDAFSGEVGDVGLPTIKAKEIAILTYSNLLGPNEKKEPQLPEDIALYYQHAVVSITTYNEDGKETGSGTGFILSRTVTLKNNKEFKIVTWANNILGKKYDLAIIKINASNLIPAIIGDSDDALAGQEIYAIGDPLGLKGSISKGLIAAKRDLEKIKLMQITAPISPGNSGGPIVNGYGEVIGVATMGFDSSMAQNINFAIPINYLKEEIEKIF